MVLTPTTQQLLDQLSAAQADLQRELKIIGRIQQSLLPEILPDIHGFDLASYYHPSGMAGGDYFDIVPLVHGAWGLVVADVAGHGAAAAVIMAVMRALIHAHLPHARHLPAGAFLEFLNRQMIDVYTRDGRFVTVWAAVLDPIARQLTYASAGHNPPRLLRNRKVLSLDAVGGLPIGIEKSAAYPEARMPLESGDLLLVYTDGITEAARGAGRNRELFDTHRLDGVLIESRHDGAQDCVKRVASAVNDFTGAMIPADDQTMVVIRVEQPGAPHVAAPSITAF